MADFTQREIEKIVNDEIKKFVASSLDTEIKKLLKNNNGQSRGEIVSIIRDAMEAVYKTLWQKREFWKSDIK